MRTLLLYPLLSLTALTAQAQSADTTQRKGRSTSQPGSATESPEANLRVNSLQVLNPNSFILTVDNRYEGQVGTPYLLPNWSNGQIVLTNGKQYYNVPIKFNAARQELMLLRPKQGNDSIIVDRGTVLGFRLEDALGQSYLFRRYPDATYSDPPVASGYFLVLYEGKTALLKRVAKTFQEANFKGGYASGNRYDTFTDANTYYLLKPDKTLVKVKLSKKSLLDALADKREQLKAAQADPSTEAGAIALVEQYNQL